MGWEGPERREGGTGTPFKETHVLAFVGMARSSSVESQGTSSHKVWKEV